MVSLNIYYITADCATILKYIYTIYNYKAYTQLYSLYTTIQPIYTTIQPIHSYTAYTQLHGLYTAIQPIHTAYNTTIQPIHNYAAYTRLYSLYTTIRPVHSYTAYTQLYAFRSLHSILDAFGKLGPSRSLDSRSNALRARCAKLTFIRTVLYHIDVKNIMLGCWFIETTVTSH